MTPSMYLVCADTEDGDNADLFVCAYSGEEAAEMWKTYCIAAQWDIPKKPLFVYLVPTELKHGVIEWDTIKKENP